MKTYSAKTNEVNQDWLLVDAEGQKQVKRGLGIRFGPLAKTNPSFTSQINPADSAAAWNSEKWKEKGNKDGKSAV